MPQNGVEKVCGSFPQQMFDAFIFSFIPYGIVSPEYVVCRTTCPVELVLSGEHYNSCLFLLSKAQSFHVTLSQSRMVYTFLLLFLCHLFLAWKQKNIVISSHMDNLS